MKQRVYDFRNKLIIGAAILLLWQAVSLFFNPWVFPGIHDVIFGTYDVITDPVFDAYHVQIFDTFRRLFIGFAIALVVGAIVGTQMGLKTNIEAFFRSWVVLGLAVPSIAVAFALIIVLGISEWVPILTIVIISTPFVMLNMWEGAQDLDHEISEMADFYGANRFQKIRHVIVPQLLPYLFPSMYWGFIVCWKVLFIAEVFGSGSGVGYMVNYWYLQRRVDYIISWVIIPIIMVIGIQELIRMAEHRMMPWR